MSTLLKRYLEQTCGMTLKGKSMNVPEKQTHYCVSLKEAKEHARRRGMQHMVRLMDVFRSDPLGQYDAITRKMEWMKEVFGQDIIDNALEEEVERLYEKSQFRKIVLPLPMDDKTV